eukprot:gene3184-3988_t
MRTLFALVLISICLAVPALSIRDTSKWTKTQRAAQDEVINFRVALTHQNKDVLEATFLDVSNPKSANYGKYWSVDEILDLIAPDFEISNSVVQFLEQNGCFNVENHRDMIKASAKSSDVERLFNVQMFNYQHKLKKNQKLIRSSGIYTIPTEIRKNVELISGISELPHSSKGPKGHKVHLDANTADPGIVIPETIQNLYGIPTGYQNNDDTSICLAEFQNDGSYTKKDLQDFATATGTPLISVDKIVGPYTPSNPDIEASLDVQYGGATAQTASVWYWTVQGWMYEFSSDFAAASTVPYVVSMSWGWPEPLQCQNGLGTCTGGETSQQYVERCNTEFQKIGLRGVTLLAASGDQGAPGDGNPYCEKAKDPISTIFPGASPYVTSVGATMLAAPSEEDIEQSVSDAPVCSTKKCATSTTEVVCTYPEALITSGGGFSNYSPMPSWQSSVVNTYLKSGVVLPSSNFFNSSNRGFPDISALGHNYYVYYNGKGIKVDGTSCSSPVVGGMVALLNSYRLNNNKPTLGFLNQLLYQAYASNPAIYNDITTGNNFCTESCCAKTGYTATKGWDPVTGLGTPNFKLLLAYVQTLN